MKTMALVLVSLLCALVLTLPQAGVSDGQILHFGQLVDDNGDSYECIACHDGRIAGEAQFCTVECSIGGNHSINAEYPPRLKENEYQPVELVLEKGIRLFNGKTSCASCHNLRTASKFFLVMDGGKLCFSCHRI